MIILYTFFPSCTVERNKLNEMALFVKRNSNNENNYAYGTSRASQLFKMKELGMATDVISQVTGLTAEEIASL